MRTRVTEDSELYRDGTLAEDLFEHRLPWVDARLEGFDAVPDSEGFQRLSDYVSLHRELLPNEHLHDSKVRCRPVPARRHFGKFRWFDPEHGALVGAHWPTFHARPSSVAVAFPAALDEDLLKRVREMGFPPPEEDPTMVIGQAERPEGATWVFVPGPEDLAELVYRLRRGSNGWDVVITAERPPKPRYEELVEELHRAFGWDGTLSFPTGQAFREKEGHLEPPGSNRIQQLT